MDTVSQTIPIYPQESRRMAILSARIVDGLVAGLAFGSLFGLIAVLGKLSITSKEKLQWSFEQAITYSTINVLIIIFILLS